MFQFSISFGSRIFLNLFEKNSNFLRYSKNHWAIDMFLDTCILFNWVSYFNICIQSWRTIFGSMPSHKTSLILKWFGGFFLLSCLILLNCVIILDVLGHVLSLIIVSLWWKLWMSVSLITYRLFRVLLGCFIQLIFYMRFQHFILYATLVFLSASFMTQFSRSYTAMLCSMSIDVKA